MPPSPTRTTLNALDLEVGMGVLSSPQGSYWCDSSQDGITAKAGGGQTNATLITTQNSRVTTVAAAGDSIKLPPAVPGLDLIIINHGVNPMQVFGSGTDTIDDVATATGVQQMQDSTTLYFCLTAGLWYTEGLAGGYARAVAGAFQTVSSGAVTASTTHTQAGATPILQMQVGVTVGNAADSVLLPPAKAGMEVTLANLSATLAMQVYASGSDTIGGTAGSTGVSQAATTLTIYYCFTTGAWLTK